MTKARQIQFILASASTRRRELLTQAGYRFKIVPSAIDEDSFFNPDKSGTAIEYAKQLALAKAKNIADKYPAELVLGADTTVDFAGQIIGKPADAEDARRITRLLFSAAHKVITAVALVRLTDNTQVVEAQVTTVFPRKLTEEQIEAHIKTGHWQDKAGAYAIRHGGDEFIEKIQGSITNVMGLPMELTKRLLSELTIQGS